MTTATMPEPFGAFLARGGDPFTVEDSAGWADWIHCCELYDDDAQRAMHAARLREDARRAISDGYPKEKVRENESLQRFVTARAWAADLFDDPTLCNRLRPMLSAEDRAYVDETAWDCAHPHTLAITRPEGWRCDACGDWFSGEAAITLNDQYRHFKCGPPQLCRGCVSIAVAALDADGS